MDNQNRTALVTGATSGIGFELAKLLAKDNYKLVITARSIEDLNAIADTLQSEGSPSVVCIEKDLFEPSAAEELYNEVKAKGITVDILINDAGQGVYGKFTDTDLQDELNIIQLNVSSLVVLTKLFLKDMVARGNGRILQLASMVSKISSPLMAVYAGTKAFVYNFTQSLINETKGTGVTITALQPGATDTDFFNKAGAENSKIVKEGKLADPADVARDGYEALMAGDEKVVSGLKNKIQATMANVLPDQALAAQMRNMNEEE
jgi:short-subunit dehydrogenase